MDDLTTRLGEAIEAKEAKARAATDGPWTLYDRGVGWEINELPDVHDGTTFTKADAEFIADNAPDEVLRGCAADRKLLDDCRKVLAVDGWEYDDAPILAETTLRSMAERYRVQTDG